MCIRYFKNKFITISGVIFIIVLLVLCYAQSSNKNEKPMTDFYAEATLQTLKEKNYKQYLHYPKFHMPRIDNQIQELINNIPKKEGITVLRYHSEKILDHYISITFHYIHQNKNKKETNEKEFIITCDPAMDQIMTFQNTFRGDFYSKLTELANNNKISFDYEVWKNSHLYYQENGIVLKLDNTNVEILYQGNEDILRLQPLHKDVNFIKKQSNSEIDPNKPMIALSFDDGPSEYTMEFMSFLQTQNANATFFMLGKNIEKYPEVVKYMYRNGFEIANHSWNHYSIKKEDVSFIKKEIFDTQNLLFRLCGDEPKLVRPPYGEFNDISKKAIEPLQITLWDVDSLDWLHRSKDKVLKEVDGVIQDGSILLFHDLYKTTLETIQYLIPELKEEGYQIVSIEELYTHHKYYKKTNKKEENI